MPCLRLLSVQGSADFINPKEPLWVTLTWQAEAPITYEPLFVLDMVFGHQRRLENMNYDSRTVSHSMPPARLWHTGDTVGVSFKWTNPFDWSGTFHLWLSVQDEQGIPQEFTGADGKDVFKQKLGSIDVSWNLGRPWMNENTKAWTVKINEPVVCHIFNEPDFISLAGDCQNGCADENADGFYVEAALAAPVLLAIGDRISGNSCGSTRTRRFPLTNAEPVVKLRHRPTGRDLLFTSSEVGYTLKEHSKATAIYQAAVFPEKEKTKTPAAEFLLTLSVNRRTLSVSVASYREYGDYELSEVFYPALAEVRDGYLVDFFGGGRLVDVGNSIPVWYDKKYDVRNAAALYSEQGLLLVESEHMDSRLFTGVTETSGQVRDIAEAASQKRQKRGFIGGAIVCRIPGNAGITGIPVQNPPVFTIELSGESNPDWRTAARLLRRGLKQNDARHLYRDAYFYKQLATFGPMPDERHRIDPFPATANLFKTRTFGEIVRDAVGLSHMTDGAKQVLYIGGWQKGGFDNTYPEPFDAEERCGGLDSLREALTELRRYNILSGLHDNFDDICFTAKEFPHTAIDEAGERWRGWIWAAGPTYIMGFKKYAESGAMAERVRKMTELLPLRDTYHIDVLTAEPWRVDYDPACMSSAEESFQAKLAVVKEFNHYGIDVTSELLCHRAVGHIGFALHTRLDTTGQYMPGDGYIPLVPMVYHGTVGYTAPSSTKRDMLWGLLIGAQTFHEVNVTGEVCVSRYYIQNIPAMMLYDKVMTDFRLQDGKAIARYGADSYVEADFSTETYRVVVDGTLVGRDFSVFVPASSPGCWLAYSFNGQLSGYTVPRALTAATVTVLTPQGDGETYNLDIKGAEMNLRIPCMTPVKIKGMAV